MISIDALSKPKIMHMDDGRLKVVIQKAELPPNFDYFGPENLGEVTVRSSGEELKGKAYFLEVSSGILAVISDWRGDPDGPGWDNEWLAELGAAREKARQEQAARDLGRPSEEVRKEEKASERRSDLVRRRVNNLLSIVAKDEWRKPYPERVQRALDRSGKWNFDKTLDLCAFFNYCHWYETEFDKSEELPTRFEKHGISVFQVYSPLYEAYRAVWEAGSRRGKN